jgi:hypothetical protein
MALVWFSNTSAEAADILRSIVVLYALMRYFYFVILEVIEYIVSSSSIFSLCILLIADLHNSYQGFDFVFQGFFSGTSCASFFLLRLREGDDFDTSLGTSLLFTAHSPVF